MFSVEYPVFTAYGTQEWIYDDKGEKACWPDDNYFYEGKREALFLGEKVVKYHRTLTTYLKCLLRQGFTIKDVIEPQPAPDMIKEHPCLKEEFRRPMMLLISAVKLSIT